jgi:hypothetical protein
MDGSNFVAEQFTCEHPRHAIVDADRFEHPKRISPARISRRSFANTLLSISQTQRGMAFPRERTDAVFEEMTNTPDPAIFSDPPSSTLDKAGHAPCSRSPGRGAYREARSEPRCHNALLCCRPSKRPPGNRPMPSTAQEGVRQSPIRMRARHSTGMRRARTRSRGRL